MKSVTHFIFKTFLLSVLVVAQMHFAYAQTASILPPAKTTFLDANGKPLTAGTVESFIPATTTHKTTWQDAAETIPNANAITANTCHVYPVESDCASGLICPPYDAGKGVSCAVCSK